MAYNANIPQPPNIMSDSQDDLLNNFLQLSAAWNINHVPYNNVAQGKHNQVTTPVNPAPTNTAANEMNIYCRTSAETTFPELVLQRENNGTRIEWTARAGNNAAGWTMLPSGIMIKWRNETIGAVDANTGIITIPWNIGPAFTTQFFAIANPAADPGNVAKDVNCIAYVYDITNPLQVSFRLWRRNQFNVIGTNQGPLVVSLFAMGV